MEEKQSVIELLKRAAKLLFGNINLAFFLFLCSLPLFCFLIFFELSLQTTISLAYQFLSEQLSFEDYYTLKDHEDLSENVLIPWLIQTSLLYLIPYSLLDLLTTTTIVAVSSIVYTSEDKPLGLLYLVQRTIKICQNRVGGAMLFHVMVVLIHGTVFVVLTAKFSKWSAGWNMGMVISVLEEDEDGQGIYGSDAFSLSAWYGRGHEKRDLWMMLVFLVLALAMRLPCLYSKCSESSSRNGVLYTSLYVGFICVGNVLKWVACVVSYHDCKTRVFEKKGDVEQAKPSAT
ncbi:hypothetical protein AALP_AA1G259100 [Arabis alpina]|uniref:Transmembrane protein n=1 Tax=Arabis alpina TaxID=50452 RepID=A0A087HQQ5_ARAAL|nr:hypothetical protein AALP_AA1G259100 [Arabis alpina]